MATSKKSSAKDTEETPKQKFFVPGHGEIEATDLADVEKQVKKLEEQEDGDGNR